MLAIVLVVVLTLVLAVILAAVLVAVLAGVLAVVLVVVVVSLDDPLFVWQSKSVPLAEEKQTVSRGTPQVYIGLLMLCCALMYSM